jgi:hypothetical protein
MEQNPALQYDSPSATYEIYGARRFITIAHSEQPAQSPPDLVLSEMNPLHTL